MIRVMLVEDDPMVAELNRNYVESIEGLKVVKIVHNAVDALADLERQPVDLILLDIYMPNMTGLDFLKEIRQKRYPTDVILVSAARDTTTINESLRLGAVDFLIKPFEFDRLRDSLKKYLERAIPLRDARDLSQHELDQLIGERKSSADQASLQKGLDHRTMKRVCESIMAMAAKDFSAEEIAQIAGISRVSAKKYLEYLEKAGAIKLIIHYGAIGRPEHRFERKPGHETIIRQYL